MFDCDDGWTASIHFKEHPVSTLIRKICQELICKIFVAERKVSALLQFDGALFVSNRSASGCKRAGKCFQRFSVNTRCELGTTRAPNFKSGNCQRICGLYALGSWLVGLRARKQKSATQRQRMVQVEGLTKLYGEFVAVNELWLALTSLRSPLPGM